MADHHSIWSPAKVFSPSAAKQQSSQAKDWSYVTAWLTARFHPDPVPPFERNADTLKALLALASANEASDDELSLSLRVKQKALRSLQDASSSSSTTSPTSVPSPASSQEPFLAALESHLTPEGTQSLNSLALLSVALGTPSPAPSQLSSALVQLSRQEFLLSHQTLRAESTLGVLRSELESVRATLREIEGGAEFRTPPDLGARVTEWARTGRVLRSKAEDYRERVAGMEEEMRERTGGGGGGGGEGGGGGRITVPELVEMEREIDRLKEFVLGLEDRARGFQGLPADKDLARVEVERMAEELEELEAERERLYDRAG